MKSADVMLLCCYASDLVIKYRKLSVGKYIRRDIQGIKRRREIDKQKPHPALIQYCIEAFFLPQSKLFALSACNSKNFLYFCNQLW